MNVGQGPAQPRDREGAETKAKAALRQSVWEATQFMSFDEVREYVEDVLYEVETDEP